MPSDFLDTFAHVHDLLMPTVQRFTAMLAKSCALIVNRYESDAIAPACQHCPVGSHIGAVVLAAFALRKERGL